MPGLAEMHAHVPSGDAGYVEEVLFLYVANGVTTARGMLGTPAHLTLRERIARHELLGPRLITSGPSLNANSVGSPEDAARLVREQASAGYDFVKVHPGPTRAEYDAAVEAARASGIKLAGHVPADVGVRRAIEARQATIDHLDGWRPIPFQAIHARHDEWVSYTGQLEFVDALRARYEDPLDVEFVVFEHTGAPHEHIGFGRKALEAKEKQLAFLRTALDVE